MNYETRRILEELQLLLARTPGYRVRRSEVQRLVRRIRNGEILRPAGRTVTVSNLSRACGTET